MPGRENKRRDDKTGASEKYKNEAGNQAPNTPNQKESARGHRREHQRPGERKSSER